MPDTMPKRKSKAENDKNIMSILLGDDADKQSTFNDTMMVDIANLVPFADHPFKLYEGERLDDMVASITNNGVLTPLIVREKDDLTYEILAGHNRANAAKIAGLTQVPVIIKRGITDEEALIYVIETNLIQRSFTDMLPSEQATILALQHSKLFSQGKRNDIILELEKLENPDEIKVSETSSPVGKKLTSLEIGGKDYGLSKNSVARLLRVDKLIQPLKERVDKNEIAIRPAVSISYLPEFEQTALESVLSETSYKVDMKNAEILRAYSAKQHLTNEKIIQILTGEAQKKKAPSSTPKPLTIKPKIYTKYFDEGTPQSEMEVIVEQALAEYFNNHKKEETE